MRNPHEAVSIGRLKRRADFHRAAKGKRWHGKALSLQVIRRDGGSSGAAGDQPRAGFTLTRKVGCAVIRNRARRRLKEALRLSKDLPLQADHDYVIVGRIEAIRLPFEILNSELRRAVIGVHGEPARRSGRVRRETPADQPG